MAETKRKKLNEKYRGHFEVWPGRKRAGFGVQVLGEHVDPEHEYPVYVEMPITEGEPTDSQRSQQEVAQRILDSTMLHLFAGHTEEEIIEFITEALSRPRIMN